MFHALSGIQLVEIKVHLKTGSSAKEKELPFSPPLTDSEIKYEDVSVSETKTLAALECQICFIWPKHSLDASALLSAEACAK